MLDSYRSLFGKVTIKETDTTIVVSGIRAKDIIRDMDKHWKTTRISQNIFNTVSSGSFSFYKFFAPEIVYILNNIKFYRNRWTSIKAINGIIEAMTEHTWLKNTVPSDHSTIKGRLDFRKLSNLTFTAKPYQMEYFENYSYRLNQYGLKGDLLAADPGTGKAISMDANIKVLGGWKKMRDIHVGDLVTAWDGTQTKVVGVFHQGVVNTIKIRFKDGRFIDACEDHQWRVYSKDWKHGGDGWKIITSRELLEYFKVHEDSLYIQLCKSEESPLLNLPVDPYNLGVILGSSVINPIFIKPSDSELNVYIHAIDQMGLLDATDSTKFIPDQYLNSSTEQRWALLQGLMDADGDINENSEIGFSSLSYKLAVGIQYLVRSLGGVAELKDTDTTYQVNIRFPKPSMAFRLTSKLDRCNDTLYSEDNLNLEITNVTNGDRTEMQCISVEHKDHLYITDDFIVTHNTFMYSAIAEMLSAELIVVFCPKVVLETVWIESVNEMFKTPQTIWHSGTPMPYTGQRWILCHYDAMNKLMEIFQDPNVYKGKNIVTVLDESHNMNDPNSLRTLTYLTMVKLLNSDNNLLGSGTPVKALGAEIITLERVIDPMFTPAVEVIFKKIYGKEASKGLDIIRHRLGISSYKVEKSEANSGLLPPIMRSYPITVPDGNRFTLPEIRKVMEAFIKERAEYYKARRPEDMKFWEECVKIARSKIKDKQELVQFDEYLYTVHLIAKTPDPRFLGDEMKRANAFEKNVFEKLLPPGYMHRFRDVKSVVKYVNLKIQGEVLGRVLGGMRIEANVAMIPYIDWVGIVESTEKKTIMFTSFVEAVETAEVQTVKLGMKPIAVYGKTSNDLVNIVKRFDSDPNLNPLLATYASLSTGVRLTMADTMILLNSPYRAYILEQAIARIYRLGQDSQTYVFQCVLNTGDIPNISTRSADILQWSTEQVEAIMGVKSSVVEGDTFEQTALESIKDGDFDDLKIFHRVLTKAFEQYDIEIDMKNFVYQEPVKPMVPAWMR